jgi:hypothetical protein
MPEIGLSGSLTGEWKRAVSHRATPRLYSPASQFHHPEQAEAFFNGLGEAKFSHQLLDCADAVSAMDLFLDPTS